MGLGEPVETSHNTVKDPGTGKVPEDTYFLNTLLLFIYDNCVTQRTSAGGGRLYVY